MTTPDTREGLDGAMKRLIWLLGDVAERLPLTDVGRERYGELIGWQHELAAYTLTPKGAASPVVVSEGSVAELDAMIAEVEGAVRFREQEGKRDVLPAFHGIDPISKKRLDVDEDKHYGERHRRIAEIERKLLNALRMARAALGAAPRGNDPTYWRDGEDGYRIAIEKDDADWVASIAGISVGPQSGHGATREDALCHLVCALTLLAETQAEDAAPRGTGEPG